MSSEHAHSRDGRRDLARAVDRLSRRLPEPLQPLARVAYDYAWTWTPGGRELFSDLDSHRFTLAGDNPVRFLRDVPEPTLLTAATDETYLARLEQVAGALEDARTRPDAPTSPGSVAFLCAEFAVHPSLPIYSGGLGVLAGDILKEAADQALPYVGVGLLYRRGYFHQRVDRTGWQHEYWIEADPELRPLVRVTDPDGRPLRISVPAHGSTLHAHVWRVEVGRVPLFLLDAEVEDNDPIARWVTARLYEGNRAIRLAQYALLGVGAVRALDAMGIEVDRFHLNEGHAALAAVADAARDGSSMRRPLAAALDAGRDRFVFTTHTPVAAGNETYGRDEVLQALGGLADELAIDREELLGLMRVHPTDANEPCGLTPLAIRAARTTNGVSARHGSIARAMWHELYPRLRTDEVPITHVTNGVHLPTWMAPPMRALLTRCFGAGWEVHATDLAMWAQVDDIPDEDLWAVRNQLRATLIERLRRKTAVDRLERGEDIDFVRAGAGAFHPDHLTVGFARRLAAYKRLHLLVHDAARAVGLLDHDQPLQLVFAGKAHPNDDGAKSIAQLMFSLKRSPAVGDRVVFVEDYDLRVARDLVAGCDVWLNLPRPPMEASGTSGMKVALNGGLNLSVLDGWWLEGYDGTNGWAIDGSVDPDEAAKDARDAEALYDIVEREVKPRFYDRDERGISTSWLTMVRASLRTLGPRYGAGRMVGDYVGHVYSAR